VIPRERPDGDARVQDGSPILEVRDLVARYGQITALKGISLRVDEGQIVALIGANGAGKSTTLRVISGLLQPATGDVLIQGRTIRRATPRAIVRMGVVHCPEGRRIFTRLTVLENLRLGHYTRGNRVLLVEQNANMALRLADRAYVLETGRIALEGSGRDLLANDAVRKSYLGEI